MKNYYNGDIFIFGGARVAFALLAGAADSRLKGEAEWHFNSTQPNQPPDSYRDQLLTNFRAFAFTSQQQIINCLTLKKVDTFND